MSLWQLSCGTLWTAVYCSCWVTDIVPFEYWNVDIASSCCVGTWIFRTEIYMATRSVANGTFHTCPEYKFFFVLLKPTICWGVWVDSCDVNSRKSKLWVSVMQLEFLHILKLAQLFKKNYSSSPINTFLSLMNHVFSSCPFKAGV